ncbi:hypothetical protein BC835DRAFT_436949 [Cytidiella melzeri]|nr:hypothetical protein BC835DRAFT_436949 [Cytidiella melzeri]
MRPSEKYACTPFLFISGACSRFPFLMFFLYFSRTCFTLVLSDSFYILHLPYTCYPLRSCILVPDPSFTVLVPLEVSV